ncbi:hypothetical protein BCR44DRAFT_55967 [Catenaria anguillulae PL171]|uniref:C3H1-type domain-containing protein n=1 Tax=Catenaria anguillulae PL171 TaxID=765915 RepID=A0A1Y2HGZ0_9FUNG|nr:hypothetical protein BCR44DRAFT_55967 [Catenaria anguillulae PL171]
MSTVYLGLAASAGAAAVYVGRRLSVKLGGKDGDQAAADIATATSPTSGAPATPAKDPQEHADLTEVVVDQTPPSSQVSASSAPTRSVGPALTNAPVTPPATPIQPPALQLDQLDPITISKPSSASASLSLSSASSISTASTTSTAPTVPLHTITEDDDDESLSMRRPMSQCLSVMSEDEREDDSALRKMQRRASNLNLKAPEFVPSPSTSRAGSPTGSAVSGQDKKDGEVDDADKPKKIRCAYWPQCKYGQLCKYWHPTHACMNEQNKVKYPNGCVYGTRCFFYHESEAVYLATMGVFPPYPRSLGIGPNTPPAAATISRPGSFSAPSSPTGSPNRRSSAMILPSQRSSPLVGPISVPAPYGYASQGSSAPNSPVALGSVQPYHQHHQQSHSPSIGGYPPQFVPQAPFQQPGFGPVPYQHAQIGHVAQHGHHALRKPRSMSVLVPGPGNAGSPPTMTRDALVGLASSTPPPAGARHIGLESAAPGHGAPRRMRSATALRQESGAAQGHERRASLLNVQANEFTPATAAAVSVE